MNTTAPAPNRTTLLASNEEAQAMFRALAAVPELTTERDDDAGTVVVYLVKAERKKKVFQALQKGGDSAPWIVTHLPGLLTRD